MIDADVLELAATAALRASGASFALVHGSRAQGTPRAESDVDVAAYWTADPPASFDVDVPDGVDLMVLNGAPLELAGRIALDGRLLFDDDPEIRVHWQATTRKLYADERQAGSCASRVPGGAEAWLTSGFTAAISAPIP